MTYQVWVAHVLENEQLSSTRQGITYLHSVDHNVAQQIIRCQYQHKRFNILTERKQNDNITLWAHKIRLTLFQHWFDIVANIDNRLSTVGHRYPVDR